MWYLGDGPTNEDKSLVIWAHLSFKSLRPPLGKFIMLMSMYIRGEHEWWHFIWLTFGVSFLSQARTRAQQQHFTMASWRRTYVVSILQTTLNIVCCVTCHLESCNAILFYCHLIFYVVNCPNNQFDICRHTRGMHSIAIALLNSQRVMLHTIFSALISGWSLLCSQHICPTMVHTLKVSIHTQLVAVIQ